MSRDSMIVYRSFYEAIKELPIQNQAEVWCAVFEFSLNFKEVKLTGISKTIFTLIKPQLQANIKRYQSGTTPKQKQEISETEAKPKRNRSKPEANVNDNVNLNDNENNNPNVNQNENLVADAEIEKVSKKPDLRINELTEYFKSKLVPLSLDGTVKENRQYCYLLLQKVKKEYPDKNEVDGIKLAIDLGVKDNFQSKLLTSFKYLYYNFNKILKTYSNGRITIADLDRQANEIIQRGNPYARKTN